MTPYRGRKPGMRPGMVFTAIVCASFLYGLAFVIWSLLK